MSKYDKKLDERKKVYLKIINNIKRKRPIQNERLDSFSWWIWVEKTIQDELLNLELERLENKRFK